MDLSLTNKRVQIVIFLILLFYISLFIFSYFWVDPHLTLIKWQPINNLITRLQHFGYFNRPLVSKIYLVILLFLFGTQLYIFTSQFVKRVPRRQLMILVLVVVLIATFSYPFLSHDIFTYLFHAKIIWHYHQNPYLKAPDDFPNDPWIRFTHWTERTAPYGPVWLLYSLLPVIFAFQKFILNFYGLKLLNGILFLISGILLLKLTKRERIVFAFWFFNPFLLLEFLTNAHNDLLVLSLFFLSLFLFEKKQVIKGWLAYVASLLSSKYISVIFFPALLFLKGKKRVIFFKLIVMAMLLYFGINLHRIHAWYFTWLFLALFFAQLKRPSWLLVYFLGFLLMIGYYPFILTGYWKGILPFIFLKGIFLMIPFVFFALQFDFWKNLTVSGKRG